jgi:hypothetical protein
MVTANKMLWLKFEEPAFAAPARSHWLEPTVQEADNIDVGPLTEADLHDDFFQSSGNPF